MARTRTNRDTPLLIRVPKYLHQQLLDHCRSREIELSDLTNYLFKQELERVERVKKADLGRKS